MNKTIRFRPLTLAQRLADAMKTPITYAYEDLVFVEHSDVLLRFDDATEDAMHLFVNSSAEPVVRERIHDDWSRAAKSLGIALEYRGIFSMEQVEGTEEIRISFT